MLIKTPLSVYRRWFFNRRCKETEKFIGHINGTVLDLGSASGPFNPIIRKSGKTKIYAADRFFEALSKNNADEKICTDLENFLPFSTESFDVVLAFEIIEHLGNRVRFISEIYRVLKPNGLLFLTTPNKCCLISKFDRIVGRHIKGGEWDGHDPHHKYLFTPTEITNLLKSFNFTILRSQGFYLFYGLPFSSERERVSSI